MEKFRYQTHSFTIQSGTAATTKGNSGAIKLDPNYDRCVAIQVFETGDTAQKYRLSLLAGSGGSGTIIDLTYKDFYLTDKTTGKRERDTEIDLKAAGQEYLLGYEILANLTQELPIDIVFKLVKD